MINMMIVSLAVVSSENSETWTPPSLLEHQKDATYFNFDVDSRLEHLKPAEVQTSQKGVGSRKEDWPLPQPEARTLPAPPQPAPKSQFEDMLM